MEKYFVGHDLSQDVKENQSRFSLESVISQRNAIKFNGFPMQGELIGTDYAYIFIDFESAFDFYNFLKKTPYDFPNITFKKAEVSLTEVRLSSSEKKAIKNIDKEFS